MASNVMPGVTDAVAQTNLTSLGNGTAVATVQSFLSSTQGQGTVFASAVRRQQQGALVSLAATVKGTLGILALSRRMRPQAPPPELAKKHASEPPVEPGTLSPGDSEAEMQKAERAMRDLGRKAGFQSGG